MRADDNTGNWLSPCSPIIWLAGSPDHLQAPYVMISTGFEAISKIPRGLQRETSRTSPLRIAAVALKLSSRDFAPDWLTPTVRIVTSAEQQSANSPANTRVRCENTSASRKS